MMEAAGFRRDALLLDALEMFVAPPLLGVVAGVRAVAFAECPVPGDGVFDDWCCVWRASDALTSRITSASFSFRSAFAGFGIVAVEVLELELFGPPGDGPACPINGVIGDMPPPLVSAATRLVTVCEPEALFCSESGLRAELELPRISVSQKKAKYVIQTHT